MEPLAQCELMSLIIKGQEQELILSLAIFSTGLCFAVPSFVRTVRSQGASYEVLDRLAFFAEMNGIRTVFRWIYSIAFVSLLLTHLALAHG